MHGLQEIHDVFRFDAFGKTREVANVAEEAGNEAPVAVEERFLVFGQDKIGNFR
jgi:hypothetical protein